MASDITWPGRKMNNKNVSQRLRKQRAAKTEIKNDRSESDSHGSGKHTKDMFASRHTRARRPDDLIGPPTIWIFRRN